MATTNFWIGILGVLSVVLIWLYFWVKKKYRYFEERGVAHVKPPFLLGNTYRGMFGFETWGLTFDRIYYATGASPFCGIFNFVKPAYMIKDPDLIGKILVKDFSSFHSHGVVYDSDVNPLDDNLFYLNGDNWRTVRSKISPVFTSGKLKWMLPQMKTIVEELIVVLDQMVSETSDIESYELMRRFGLDIMGSCVFGLDSKALKGELSIFEKICMKVLKPSHTKDIILTLKLALPRLFKMLRIKTKDDEVTNFFLTLVSQTFQKRLESGNKRRDFVQLLLELKEKGILEYDRKDYSQVEDHKLEQKIRFEMTDGLLTAQAFSFLLGGFGSFGTGLNLLLYQLAKNPDVQDKLRKEIREVKAKYGDFTYEAINEMNFLEACFVESQRLMSPIQFLIRKCFKEYNLHGVTLPEGAHVIIPVFSIHHDPKYYPQPEVFDPERFITEESRKSKTFLAFGDGPRICIGKRFALVEIKLTVAYILDYFEIFPSSLMKEPLQFSTLSFSLVISSSWWLKFKRIH